jgi:hypothetical protein
MFSASYLSLSLVALTSTSGLSPYIRFASDIDRLDRIGEPPEQVLPSETSCGVSQHDVHLLSGPSV